MVKGERGPHVAEAQRQLLSLGYPVGLADGICGPKTLAAWEAWERAKAANVTVRMGAHKQEAKKGVRDWGAVTGVCLHQTACDLGEKPDRWNTLRAQVGVAAEEVDVEGCHSPPSSSSSRIASTSGGSTPRSGARWEQTATQPDLHQRERAWRSAAASAVRSPSAWRPKALTLWD
jgi:peptidoglycan hydrolase-like protein with peptidoglycan-binding domain